MKKTAITYLLFIVCLVSFVTLRVHAGHVLASEIKHAETADKSDTSNETSPVVINDSKPAEEKEDDASSEFTDEKEYLWHGVIDPVAEYSDPLPRIICWGDSLTVSLDEKSAYPDILRDLSGCEVINYGVESESASMIAMREGGIRVNVKATVIPSDTKLIPVFLRTEDDGHVFFLDNGDGGVNPCVINGIEGQLEKLNGSYYFRRNTKGERVAIEDGTQFKTHGMVDARMGDVLVIFAGTNDLPTKTSVSSIIKIINGMLEAAKCDRYIIVGLTYAGGIRDIDDVNAALEEAYGDNFVDIRKYMLYYGLKDCGIQPTADDKEDIAKGEIPSSLRKDYVHGNKHYHRLLGQQIYRRMQYLGYLPAEGDI